MSLITPAQSEASPPGGDVVIVDSGQAVPLADEWADHLIIPAPRMSQRYLLAREMHRIVRPGGHLFLAVRALVRATRQGRADAAPRSAAAARCGVAVVEQYAIRPGLHNPRHLVPATSNEALRWSVERAYLPLNVSGLLRARFLRRIPSRAMALTLFPALGLRARRVKRQVAR
ncbi:MAG: hypothetical protein M3387_08480 [Actinomycetota bacterium]|nr:hypothetical protein [Actinomycetota bacterium]